VHYSTGGTEAVEGKNKFEQLAQLYAVQIKVYQGDNGIMSKMEYMTDITLKNQTITLAGVDSHHRNRIAEHNIWTLCDRACTMPLRAIDKWPMAITPQLWPFALKMAVDIDNAPLNASGLSPEEIFRKQKAHPDRLLDFHTF
jgi:hypothetical protein